MLRDKISNLFRKNSTEQSFSQEELDRIQKEEPEDIKTLIKTANVALDDKTKQIQEELTPNVRKR